MMEVWAAHSEYTDAQIGRMIDYLEETGQLENTVVIYAADNGTSGEGSPNGSVNENKFFNGWPDTIEENLKYIDSCSQNLMSFSFCSSHDVLKYLEIQKLFMFIST